MAFVNQFQPLAFNNLRFKVLQVLCTREGINETGFADFAAITGAGAGTLTANTSGELLLDGTVIDPTTVTVAPVAINPITLVNQFISNGKVFNVLTVLVNVFVAGIQINGAPLPITVTGEIECDCPIIPTDNIQKHDVTFVGGTVAAALAPAPVVRVTVDVDLCLVVSRETIVRLNAAIPFCG